MKKSDKRVPIGIIIREFWGGIAFQKWLFWLSCGMFFFCNILSVVIPKYLKTFFDTLQSNVDPKITAVTLVHIVLTILIIKVIYQVIWQIGSFIYTGVQVRAITKIKQNAFDYMMRHSYTFFANTFSGSLVQKVNRFGRAIETVMDTIVFGFSPIIFYVAGAILVTWSILPILSIIMMGWVVSFMAISVIFAMIRLRSDAIVAEADSAVSGYLSDSITNNTAVSFFTGFDYESKNFNLVVSDQARKTLTSWRTWEVIKMIQMLMIALIEFFIFYFAIKYWKTGNLSIGTFVLGQSYVILLSQQMWNLSGNIRAFYQAIADSKDMVDVLITPYEIKDLPDSSALNVKGGEITFHNVSFSFGKQENTLKNLNTTIKPHEKVAMVGPSGAGKTTFVRLIMRLYDVTDGKIEIDGQDITKVTQDSLRENISFVPQDPILFHRTLMDNIRYGKRDATDEEVIAAARLAHCDEFIEKLPLKYETFVGERGIKLSGGERQRVAIARAILKKAPILIFDEATSSLDSHSESMIQDALETLMKTCTTIVIVHRLSTIKKMDRIIVMKDGEIAEEGTHDELANKESGLYKKLWDLQVGGFL